MKLVIYRDKNTNEIKDFDDWKPNCTEDALKSYNENTGYLTKAEIVELEEDSLAYYFYTMKKSQLEDEAEELRDLMNDITNIANRIDDKLYDFDRWFEEERGKK